MIDVFRDESMTAVFGVTYDQADNGWRIDQDEKVFSKCTGEARPANRPMNARGINLGQFQRPLPREYPQEFQQYRELIREAFGGSPGRFEPAAVIRYVQGVRQQITLANSELSSGASAAPMLEAFEQLQRNRARNNQQLAMLRPNERELADRYLSERQSELAPQIADEWLRGAANDAQTLDSAQKLETTHRQMTQILGKLDAAHRDAANAAYNRLLDADILHPIEAETAKLKSLPGSWEGAAVERVGSLVLKHVRRVSVFRCLSYGHVSVRRCPNAHLLAAFGFMGRQGFRDAGTIA